MPAYFGKEWGNAAWLFDFGAHLNLRAAVYQADELAAFIDPSPELTKLNIDVQLISNPSDATIQALSAVPDVYYAPAWITWNQPVSSMADLLANRGNQRHQSESEQKKRLSDFERAIAKCQRRGIRIETQPLSELNWEIFYKELYQVWILSKNAGFDYAGPDFARQQAAEGALPRYLLIELRDETQDNQLIGGSVLEDMAAYDTIKVKFAAFNRGDLYKNLSLSYYSYNEAVNVARTLGRSVMSYGTDPNFYADEPVTDMTSIGLHRFKSHLCFAPVVLDKPGYDVTKLFRFVGDKWRQHPYIFYKYMNSAKNSPLELVSANS